MIDFFILYEIPTRELESVLILANELKCRGYSVEIASFYDVNKTDYLRTNRRVKKYRNNVKVLLVPSFYHNNEMLDMFYFPFGRVEKVVNLRWEQYFINEVMEKPQEHQFLFPNESGKNVFHVCWGNVSHKTLVDFGIAEDRLLDTGPLHMDTLRDEFRELYLSKSELLSQYDLNSEKQTVLFISSFANATDKSTYHKYLEKFFEGKYKVDYSRIELEQASYELSLRWFDDFMAAHKDINFVYRPHPSEFTTEKLRKLEEKHPNFKVIRDYSVKQWILACETIVTWMSTSIVEAFFANKACFIIRPVHFPFEKDMCVYNGAQFITEEADFLNISGTVCKNSLSEEYIHRCYDVQPSRPSYIRLCDELEKIITTPEVFPWDEKLLRRFDRKRPFLALMDLWAIMKRFTKNRLILLMQMLQKYAKISFGKKIDSKLKVRKNNTQIYQYKTGVREKEDLIAKIIRGQRKPT